MAIPSDLKWAQQMQAMTDVNAPSAWDKTLGTADVVICVVSTGIAKTHADLTRLDARSVNSDGTPAGGPSGTTAVDAIGTTLAGVAAAAWSAGGDIAGIAGGCKLVSVALPAGFTAFSDANKSSNMANALGLVTALALAAPLERWVVLLHPKQFIWSAGAQTALDNLVATGSVVVVPAGDDVALQYPANSGGVISVGAVTHAGVLWSDPGPPAVASATGPGLTLVAPGLNIWTTDLPGANGINATDYAQVSGTGIAAAHVAGAAALVLSVNEKLAAADVRAILEATASHPALPDNSTGYGLLNIGAALTEALKPHGNVTAPGSLAFGNVAEGLRAYKTLHVERVNSTTTVGANTFTVYSNPIAFTIPNLDTLSPNLTYLDGTTGPKTVTLALGDAPQDLIVRYSAPPPPDTPSGTLTVTTDDRKSLEPLFTPSAYSFPFSATAVADPIVDVVLIIDHSGSMSEPSVAGGGTSKADAAVSVASLGVTTLSDNDHFGVVRFDDLAGDPDDVLEAKPHTTGTFAGLRTAGALGSAQRNALRGRLTTAPADLGPRGSTSIGGGIQLGYDLILSEPSTGQRKNLIVLTDGLENTDPLVATILASIDLTKVRVFGVGVGLNRSDTGLMNIATVTNGYVLPTGPEASDPKLACILSQIIADASDASFALDPSGQLHRGEEAVVEFNVAEVDYRVDFTLLFDPKGSFPETVRVAFELPDGTKILDNQVIADQIPGASAGGATGHMLFRFLLPIDPTKPKRTIGKWKVEIRRPGAIDVGRDQKSQDNRDIVNWSLMVTTRSDLVLGGRITQTGTSPGTPMTVILEPTLGGLPVALDTDPTVSITRPDGVVRNLLLARDPYGAYSNVFTDTSIAGAYSASADVTVTTPAGVRIVRHRQMGGNIVPPGGWGWAAGGETPVGGGTLHGAGGGGRGGPGSGGPNRRPLCCELIECLLHTIERRCRQR